VQEGPPLDDDEDDEDELDEPLAEEPVDEELLDELPLAVPELVDEPLDDVLDDEDVLDEPDEDPVVPPSPFSPASPPAASVETTWIPRFDPHPRTKLPARKPAAAPPRIRKANIVDSLSRFRGRLAMVFLAFISAQFGSAMGVGSVPSVTS
jgi:hypothetical protein